MCAPDQPRPTEALSGRPFSARVRALPSGASQPGGDGAASRGGPESPGPEAGLSLAWRGSIDEPASGLPDADSAAKVARPLSPLSRAAPLFRAIL